MVIGISLFGRNRAPYRLRRIAHSFFALSRQSRLSSTSSNMRTCTNYLEWKVLSPSLLLSRYCFRLDRSIVNVYMPYEKFADAEEKMVGLIMWRVNPANVSGRVLLQSATDTSIDPATRSLPGALSSAPLPLDQSIFQLMLSQWAQQQQLANAFSSTRFGFTSPPSTPMQPPSFNLNMVMTPPAQREDPESPTKRQKVTDGDVSEQPKTGL